MYTYKEECVEKTKKKDERVLFFGCKVKIKGIHT